VDNVNIINTSSRLFCEGLKIDFYENCPDPDWDNFLSHLPGAHIERTSLWALFRAHYGWRSVRWVARKNGQIVGGIQMLLNNLMWFGQRGYVIRGPHVLKDFQPFVDEFLIDFVIEFAIKKNLLFLVFELPYWGEGIANILDKREFGFHPKGVPPVTLMTATLLLDLRQSVDDIFKKMLPSVRRNVRIGMKSEFEMVVGGKEDLEIFYNLILAICARRGVSPLPSHSSFFKRLWDVMEDNGWVKLFLLKLKDEVVSGAFAFTFGDTIRVWKVGWSGEHGDKKPNHFLWWSIILWAKENGFRELDFVWVDEDDVILLARGEKNPNVFRDGTTFFKMGFGGRLVMIPEPRSQFFHPFLKVFPRRWLFSIIQASGLKHSISFLWNKNQLRKHLNEDPKLY